MSNFIDIALLSTNKIKEFRELSILNTNNTLLDIKLSYNINKILINPFILLLFILTTI